MILLTSANSTTTEVASADATFAGLFTILFLVIVGGGISGVWFVAKHALSFFNSYRDTTNKQMKDFTEILHKLSQSQDQSNLAQERITHVLERIEHNSAIHSQMIGDVDNRVHTMDKLVSNYQTATNEKLSVVNAKVEIVDDKVDSLSKDIQAINMRLEATTSPKVTKMKGADDLWRRNVN